MKRFYNRFTTSVIVIVVVVICLGLYAFYVLVPDTPKVSLEQSAPSLQYKTETISLDGNQIAVQIADTQPLQELGLGNRASIAPNTGMLFVFSEDKPYAFWMKDMQFSIDMIWIDSNHAIVYMAQNVSPQTYPENFVPTSPARYVLELPAGYAAAHGVKVGDTVQF